MKKNILVLLFYVLTLQNAYSQSSWNAVDYTFFKTQKTYDIDEIIASDALFIPLNEFDQITKPKDIFWFRIDLSENPPSEVSEGAWFLKFKTVDHGDLYFLEEGNIIKIPIGKYDIGSKADFRDNFSEVQLEKHALINNRYLYINSNDFTSFKDISAWQFDYVCIYEYSDLEPYRNLMPLYIFTGVCLIVFLLTFSLSVYFKDWQYFYYAFYILLIFVYLSAEPFGLNDLLFGKNSLVSLWFLQTLKIVFNIVYIWFCMQFLDVKHNYRGIYKPLIAILFCEFLLILFNSYFLLSGLHLYNIYLIHFHHIFMIILVAMIFIIYVVANVKNNLSYFIVTGASFYFISFLAQYYLNFPSATWQFFKDNNYFLITGFTLEIIIFTFGFAYKILQDYNEKLRLERESFQNKTIALRAQINPHFIFNSLGSIQHLITSDNKLSALKYLSKFSKFTRKVLETSSEQAILLSEEISILKDYLELESLRFKNLFKYSIKVSESLDPGAIEIPILVVQPFVENAIIHGLLNKKDGEKMLSIDFFQKDDFLICEVEDNGVGRNFYKEKKSIRKRKSIGLQVTKERLKLFNQTGAENDIEIIDKASENGKSLGTKAIIRILMK